MGCAMLFSTLLGTVLGVLSAWRRGEFADVVTMGGVLFVGSLPPFWLAMMLIILFSTTLGWLPSFGAYQLGTSPGSLNWYIEVGRRLIMPVLALGLVQAASVLLIARSSMTIALDQDYITFARAKGVSEGVVFFRHALQRVAAALYARHDGARLAGRRGAGDRDRVRLSGLGSLIVMGVNSRDYTLLQGLFAHRHDQHRRRQLPHRPALPADRPERGGRQTALAETGYVNTRRFMAPIATATGKVQWLGVGMLGVFIALAVFAPRRRPWPARAELRAVRDAELQPGLRMRRCGTTSGRSSSTERAFR